MYSRCDSKHPVLMPRLRTAPGGARCWSTEGPEVAWRLVADSSLPQGSRLVTASWRALAPALRVCENPGPVRASDARRSPCRANCEHRDGCGAFPGAPCAATSPSADEEVSAFASTAALLALLSRDRGSHHRAVPPPKRAGCRLVASVFVITREHHLASRSILAGSATPSARCDASPFVLRAAQRVLRPIRRPAPIRWFVASFRFARVCEQRPGWCAEHLVVAPAWSPVRRYRRPARQRVSPGPS